GADVVLDAVEVRVDLAADERLVTPLAFAEGLEDAPDVRPERAGACGLGDLQLGLVLPIAHRAIVLRPLARIFGAAGRRLLDDGLGLAAAASYAEDRAPDEEADRDDARVFHRFAPPGRRPRPAPPSFEPRPASGSLGEDGAVVEVGSCATGVLETEA